MATTTACVLALAAAGAGAASARGRSGGAGGPPLARRAPAHRGPSGFTATAGDSLADDVGAHELVTLVVPPSVDTEVLAELLMETGALYVAIKDANLGTPDEAPIVRPVNPAAAAFEAGEWPPRFDYWSNCTIEAGFALGWPVEQTLRSLEDTLGTVLARQPPTHVPSKDWVTEVQRTWPPIVVGELYVRFPWHPDPPPAGTRASLVLEPGMAFGTGEHPTTRLCCEWLQRELAGAARHASELPGVCVDSPAAALDVLDYGSGSGILALAALAFGASTATCVDTDREANRVAMWNANVNGLSERVSVHTPDDAPAVSFPLVVANILAPTLIALAPTLAAATLPGGRIGLSGVLVRQAAGVRAAYERAFELDEADVEDGGWVLISGTRRQPSTSSPS